MSDLSWRWLFLKQSIRRLRKKKLKIALNPNRKKVLLGFIFSYEATALAGLWMTLEYKIPAEALMVLIIPTGIAFWFLRRYVEEG